MASGGRKRQALNRLIRGRGLRRKQPDTASFDGTLIPRPDTRLAVGLSFVEDNIFEVLMTDEGYQRIAVLLDPLLCPGHHLHQDLIGGLIRCVSLTWPHH
jgi:hypothetical protein